MKIVGTRREPRAAEAPSYGVDANDKDTAETIGVNSSYFPRFLQLPAEIQDEIWELYCPDILGHRRVFNVYVEHRPLLHYGGHRRLCVEEGRHRRTPLPLSRQTRAFRRLSAVHGATRARALRVAPDVFHLRIPDDDKDGLIAEYDLRFHASRDVIVLDSSLWFVWPPEHIDITGLARNVAVAPEFLHVLAPHFSNVVEVVYLLVCACQWPLRKLAWCATPAANYYDIGWGKPVPSWLALQGVRHWALGGVSRFCFADRKRWCAHADATAQSFLLRLTQLARRLRASRHIDLLPMVVFKGKSHMAMYDQLTHLSQHASGQED